MALDTVRQRQLELGAAAFFRPEAENPPGNQIVVKAGFAFRGAYAIQDQFTGGDQTTAGFASVSGAGLKRYDLVYLDINGAVQILQGNEVAAAAPAFDGAPGFNLGPDLPDQAVPTAYVLVDEPGAVTVDSTDIYQTTGFISISRDLNGYRVDKGLLGSAPSGVDDDVSAIFAGDTPGGSTTVRGTVTTAPLNFVVVVDQDANELIRTADGSQVYARLTEAGGVWTLSYFANVAGTETVVDVDADITTTPTDLRLIAVPTVFSQNDPNRPLFPDSVSRLSDLAAADIPTATVALQGKVIAAANSPAVPQAGSLNRVLNNGVLLAGGPWNTINLPSGGATDAGGGVVDIPASTGPPGADGLDGGPGPPGPGFSSASLYNVSTEINVPGGGGGSNTQNVGYGFTIRFMAGSFNKIAEPSGDLNGDTVQMTSMSGIGTTTGSIGYSVVGGVPAGDTIFSVQQGAAG
jgi:hypothetical protein